MSTLLGGWVVSGINNLLVVNRIYHWIQRTQFHDIHKY